MQWYRCLCWSRLGLLRRCCWLVGYHFGNLLSIGIGGIITVAWSYIHPANFDWDITRSINNKEDFILTENNESSAKPLAYEDEKEKLDFAGEGLQDGVEPTRNTTHTTVEAQPTDMAKENEELQKAFRFAAVAALSLIVILIFVSFHLTFLARQYLKLTYTKKGHPSSLIFRITRLPRQGVYCLGLHLSYLVVRRSGYGRYLPRLGG